MKDLRIVFMGTPTFAVESLKILIENKYNVVGVITAPDRPAGRGRQLKMSDVKKFAVQNDLKVLQPTNLKDPSFLNSLKELNPNLQVVVAFRMLPIEVWEMPKYGTFNLHASLLPNYRGAAPIHWAIINGECTSGLTTFFIDEKIDTGEIINQVQIDIGDTETVGELHDRMMVLGSKLVLETVEAIEKGVIKTQVQKDTDALRPAPKLNRENSKIDWSRDVSEIFNKIRGLNPFPAAWTEMNNNGEVFAVKIYAIDKKLMPHKNPPGKIEILNDAIRVYAKNGYINILEIQLPGKRKMDVKSLLNGFDIHQDAKML